MKRWAVVILDGYGINHHWYVSARNKYDALWCVLVGWNEQNYGMPYGIEKSGIRDVAVFPVN